MSELQQCQSRGCFTWIDDGGLPYCDPCRILNHSKSLEAKVADLQAELALTKKNSDACYALIGPANAKISKYDQQVKEQAKEIERLRKACTLALNVICPRLCVPVRDYHVNTCLELKNALGGSK